MASGIGDPRFLLTSRKMSLTPRLAVRLSCSLARRLNVPPWVLESVLEGIGATAGLEGLKGMEGINVARGVPRYLVSHRLDGLVVSRARCHWLAVVGASRSACIFCGDGLRWACSGPVVGLYVNGSDVKRQVEAGGPMSGLRIPFRALGLYLHSDRSSATTAMPHYHRMSAALSNRALEALHHRRTKAALHSHQRLTPHTLC